MDGCGGPQQQDPKGLVWVPMGISGAEDAWPGMVGVGEEALATTGSGSSESDSRPVGGSASGSGIECRVDRACDEAPSWGGEPNRLTVSTM